MTKSYEICTKCVMDTSDPDIHFGADGVCCHCRNYDARIRKDLHLDDEGQQHLKRLIESIKRRYAKKKYDCLIGVSGGVDSTYVAYVAKKILGLRPLAVHFDNGWNSELSVKNIEQTLKRLDIDLYTHVMDWEEFRDLQRSFIEASIINWEIPTDHGITALLYKIAAKYNIKYIFGGGNIATEAIMPISWVFYARDLKHLKSVHRKLGTRPLRTFPTMSMSKFLYYTFVRGIRWFPVLNYFDYNKEQVMQIIQGELGWKYYGGKHYESIFTRFYQGYVLPEKFGVDKRRAHYSTLINSGQLKRADALAELEKPQYDPEQFAKDYQFFLKKFDLTDEMFKEILDRPVVPHRSFGSDVILFEKLGKWMAFVKRIATANYR